MRFGPRVLFENVTCTFMAGRRYAVTGPNGAGKSTFMKILTGELDSTHGSVTRPKRMGVLRQDQFAFDEYRVIDTVIMGNVTLWKALVERDALYAKPHDELTDADGMRLGELEGVVGEEGGYSAESDAGMLLDGLGVESTLHERKMGELQGGQKVRVLLAQALFGNPIALLLDEPTNNLDLDSVHWLQRYLCEYEGVLIVISHDRHFLNSVCTHTADIDYETIIMYNGGYDDMVMAKTQVRARIEAENANREKKIAQLQEFIARFSAGTRSAQATSRKKEVERLQTSELARSNIQRPYIKFDMKRNSGRHPLEIRSIEKSYGELKVIPRFSASVVRGEKIALMGRNGAGKTTLLRTLNGLVPPASGTIEYEGSNIAGMPTPDIARLGVGYVPQGRQLFAGMTVAENLALGRLARATDGKDGIVWSEDKIYEYFPRLKERMYVAADYLSGGEQQMLAVARALSGNVKLLLLDEPFEGLAPNIVKDLFKVFDQLRGRASIIIVEHNLDLVLALADRVFALERGTMIHQGPAKPLLTDLAYRKQILWV
jgi:ATPase subunit of ABC transporter with duplicated ATPase domains